MSYFEQELDNLLLHYEQELDNLLLDNLSLQGSVFVPQEQFPPHRKPLPLQGHPVTLPLADIFNFLVHCERHVQRATDSSS